MTRDVMKQADVLLKEKQVIFWDFDGVIKDSLAVKSLGFERLFSSYGVDIVEKVRDHHNAHGGISRYEKYSFIWTGRVNRQLRIKFRRFVGDLQIWSSRP